MKDKALFMLRSVTNGVSGMVSLFIVPPPTNLNSLQAGQCLIHLCFPRAQQDT